MHQLKIIQGTVCRTARFDGEPLLAEVLRREGLSVPMPCGGRGQCGKCAAVSVSGAVSDPSEPEREKGMRLLCQTRLLGDAEVVLPEEAAFRQIELSAGEEGLPVNPMPGRIGAAVDVGTTTLAVKVLDLRTGACLSEGGLLNPQTSAAADVMGRIGAALEGRGPEMRSAATEAIRSLIPAETDSLVITGNTTMLYLLTGRDPRPLSAFPFEADCLFDFEEPFLGRPAYYPPCMHAFVGADISCSVLASGMWEKEESSLLCDLGTNGEMALKKGNRLYVTSTAAGPAFEGAGISCGCGSVEGAVDRVWLENGTLCLHTVAEKDPVGVCGSGLIDAVAAFLQLGLIDETGLAEEDLRLCRGLCLTQKDVRQVQLAKAAIAAGMETLMETAGVRPEDIGTLYIAGGFGSHLNVAGAVAIGLIPEALAPKAKVLGNASLTGAARMLLNRGQAARLREIAAHAEHVNLGGNPRFNDAFMEKMMFE